MPIAAGPASGGEERTDEQLIAAINAGNDSAFEVLYYRHRGWVAALARRFTRDDATALDVLQETFAYLAGKFPGFVLTARMTTFLYPVVKNISLAMRRKQSRLVSLENATMDCVVAPAVTSTDSRAELAAVMSDLPDAQREVVLMRFVDGFTLEEISSALDIPVGTVKSRLHIGLNTLRKDQRVKRYFS